MRRLSCIILLFFLGLPAGGQSTYAPSNATRAAADTVRTDSLRADTSVSAFDKSKIKIIKRDINSRHYILLAIGMMIFLALILTTVQTWNPG